MSKDEMTEPLMQGARVEKPMPYYVLVFPNVFAEETKDPQQKEDTILLKVARERLDLILAPLQQLDDIYHKHTASDPSAPKVSLAQTVRDKIEWATPSFSAQEFPKKTYQRDMMSLVVWLLENQCGFNTNYYYSRDLDEIFCTLLCTEEKLRERADIREYMLQMKNPREEDFEKYAFMKVFPYVEFSESISNLQLLKHYDDNGEESEDGSLFGHIDKTRLSFGLLSKMLSLDNLRNFEVLKDHYCVHHPLQLNQLKRDWATILKVFTPQPIDRIRAYFGERVALYFAWIGFYATCMLVAAVVGLTFFIVNRYALTSSTDTDKTYGYVAIGFSLFLSLWATFFDQLWVRRERELAWTWGTVNFSTTEEQRGEYRGEIEEDPVTGKKRKRSESSLLRLFKHSTSFSVAMLFVGLVFSAVMGIFMYKATLKGDRFGMMMCGVINALQIKIMNFIYYIVARKMNDWENHETESAYTEALSVKLFLFRFINSYISLFYIAFMKVNQEGCGPEGLTGEEGKPHCQAELTTQLGSIFITNMGFNILELGIPYIKDVINVWLEERELNRKRQENPEMRSTMSLTERQAKMAPYETPLEDYMEMVCQYGYVVMFSSVFTIVPVLALVEIMLEIRVDSWKLCNLTRRPFPYKAETIGVWYTIIQAVSYMGIITNTALIMFSSTVFSFDDTKSWLWFIVLEHILILVKLIVSMVIPDEPTVVKFGLQWSQRKAEEQVYQRKMDVKQEFMWQVLRISKEDENNFRIRREQLCAGKTE